MQISTRNIIINDLYLLVESWSKPLFSVSRAKMWLSYACNCSTVVYVNFYLFLWCTFNFNYDYILAVSGHILGSLFTSVKGVSPVSVIIEKFIFILCYVGSI